MTQQVIKFDRQLFDSYYNLMNETVLFVYLHLVQKLVLHIHSNYNTQDSGEHLAIIDVKVIFYGF